MPNNSLLIDVLERRYTLHAQVSEVLAPFSRETALGMLLSFISLDELERHIIPVLTGEYLSSGNATSSGA